MRDKTGFRGGPAYYMALGLNKYWMGALFAVLITLPFGLVFNSVQSNTIAIAFENSFGTNRLTLGLVMTAAYAFIIFGGIKRIAKMSAFEIRYD
ncbi:Amino-acid carrier protein AlsT [compost metagenome]